MSLAVLPARADVEVARDRIGTAVRRTPVVEVSGDELGVAYDLFGNGRTAVKFALGKYIVPQATAVAKALHPSTAISASTTRTWSDANRDYVPNCDLTSPVGNGRNATNAR